MTMQSNAVPNQFRASRHRRDDLHRSDIGQIIEDARDFENEHGATTASGWLLNHPLRKLLFCAPPRHAGAARAAPRPRSPPRRRPTPAKARTRDARDVTRNATRRSRTKARWTARDPCASTKAGLLGAMPAKTLAAAKKRGETPTKKRAKNVAATPTKKRRCAKKLRRPRPKKAQDGGRQRRHTADASRSDNAASLMAGVGVEEIQVPARRPARRSRSTMRSSTARGPKKGQADEARWPRSSRRAGRRRLS